MTKISFWPDSILKSLHKYDKCIDDTFDWIINYTTHSSKDSQKPNKSLHINLIENVFHREMLFTIFHFSSRFSFYEFFQRNLPKISCGKNFWFQSLKLKFLSSALSKSERASPSIPITYKTSLIPPQSLRVIIFLLK